MKGIESPWGELLAYASLEFEPPMHCSFVPQSLVRANDLQWLPLLSFVALSGSRRKCTLLRDIVELDGADASTTQVTVWSLDALTRWQAQSMGRRLKSALVTNKNAHRSETRFEEM